MKLWLYTCVKFTTSRAELLPRQPVAVIRENNQQVIRTGKLRFLICLLKIKTFLIGGRPMSRSLALAFAFLLLTTAAVAQTGTSGITGSVRDATGAVVPGATVTALNE